MDYFINTRLLSNPLNWLSIGAMLLIIAACAIAVMTRVYHNNIASIVPDDGTSMNIQPEN